MIIGEATKTGQENELTPDPWALIGGVIVLVAITVRSFFLIL